MFKTDYKTGFAYWFVHFAVEVLCFYTLFKLFQGGKYWWLIGVYYDTLAFVPQALFGAFCEKHPKFRPGLTGGILITAGALIMLLTAGIMTGSIGGTELLTPDLLPAVDDQFLLLTLELSGLLLLTAGNGLIHILGALTTLRVSRGRLAESAIFVGGGSFGVITGRILAGIGGTYWIPFVMIIAATVVMIITDRNVRRKLSLTVGESTGDKKIGADPVVTGADEAEHGSVAFDFDRFPCAHELAADRSNIMIIIVLAAVVAVRAYIGYGLPTAWNKTLIQTVFLFVFMGCGKMAGGILSDIFGARAIGIISCLVAAPLLLVSNNIMWLSLIGVALFSMTMAVTLGGLVSVMPKHPGIAFGITTFALWFGSMPVFLFGLPEQSVCNVLIAVLSVLAAAGLFYSLRKKERISA